MANSGFLIKQNARLVLPLLKLAKVPRNGKHLIWGVLANDLFANWIHHLENHIPRLLVLLELKVGGKVFQEFPEGLSRLVETGSRLAFLSDDLLGNLDLNRFGGAR